MDFVRSAFFLDGYNLFYGLLAHTDCKWLDLAGLVSDIASIHSPNCQPISFQYFTAPVQPKLASRGEASKRAQDSYFKALKATGVEIISGRHQVDPARTPVYTPGQPPNRQQQVDIWKIEEKETDVNLSIEMYRAATKAHLGQTAPLEQIVLVSADTDMGPALRAIREDFPNIQVGVILPIREDVKRTPPGTLVQYAHWSQLKVSRGKLQQYQLPERVATGKKPAIKPHYW